MNVKMLFTILQNAKKSTFFQNSTRDALHQRRSSNELNSVANVSGARSASISVASGSHLMASASAKNETASRSALPAILSTSTSSGSIAATSSQEAGLRDLLSESESWTFDIFALERISEHR